MPEGLLITGLNGCGKSTVCKALAEKLNYFSMDVEDYYFIDSDIPYSKFHTHEETKKLMLDDIIKHKNYVLATVNCDWGEEILSTYKFAVVLSVPLNVRMARIKEREYRKFGDRVLQGGDLYESQQKFHKKVSARGKEHMDNQRKYIKCPILELEAVISIDEIVDIIYQKYLEANKNE